jgi:hypothetical protein
LQITIIGFHVTSNWNLVSFQFSWWNIQSTKKTKTGKKSKKSMKSFWDDCSILKTCISHTRIRNSKRFEWSKQWNENVKKSEYLAGNQEGMEWALESR